MCHPFALAIITGLSTIEIRHLHFSLSPITVRIFGSPVAFLSVRFWRLVHIGSIQFRLVLLLPLHPTVLQRKARQANSSKVYDNRHGQEHDVEVISDILPHFCTKTLLQDSCRPDRIVIIIDILDVLSSSSVWAFV